MAMEQSIEVLREMVRLAEGRRGEALDMIEKMNKYNLALIAFAGTFLSLLISTNVPLPTLRFVGAFLILTVISSLVAIRPQKIRGGAPDISDDIRLFQEGKGYPLSEYLLAVASVTNEAASELHFIADVKKKFTILAALLLAFSLLLAYILFAYA